MMLFEELLDDLLTRDVSFYVCRMPESNTLEFGAQIFTKDIIKYKDLSEIKDEGFTLSPFAYPENYAYNRYDYSYFIKSEYCLKFDINDNGVAKETIESIKFNFKEIPVYSNKIISKVNVHDKESYIMRCRRYIKEAQSGNIKKCILSRVIFKEELSVDMAGKLFINLIKQNPAAMVSLVYIPGEVCWVTASPEQLLKVKDGFVHTMSLAGTREAVQSNDKNISSWGEKDIIEQNLVSEYIDYKLKIAGITEYSKSETVTLKAGLVEHLCTLYKIKSEDNYVIGRLLSEINPTPAVCGMPLHSAFSLICDTEGYDREFYAGYLGKITSSLDMNLFVNLRCASLGSNGGYIYVGGGITADSNPDSEWVETELKAKTILKALANE